MSKGRVDFEPFPAWEEHSCQWLYCSNDDGVGIQEGDDMRYYGGQPMHADCAGAARDKAKEER